MNETTKTSQSSSSLPPRLREPAFRRFEPFLSEAVKAYPSPVAFNPALLNLSAFTFAYRFRDAKASYLRFNWTSSQIDREKFLRIHSDLAISDGCTAGGLNRVGPKRVLLEQVSGLKVSNITAGLIGCTVTPGVQTDAPLFVLETYKELELLAQLAAARLLTQEVHCTVKLVAWIAEVEMNYDVSIQVLDETKGEISLL